jgi:hypothetical protein
MLPFEHMTDRRHGCRAQKALNALADISLDMTVCCIDAMPDMMAPHG